MATSKIDKSTEMRQRWGKKEEEKKAWSSRLGGEIEGDKKGRGISGEKTNKKGRGTAGSPKSRKDQRKEGVLGQAPREGSKLKHKEETNKQKRG